MSNTFTFPLSLANLTTPPTADDWNTEELALADVLLPPLATTSWQQGGVERTLIAVQANALAECDIATSVIAQAGFLDFAAVGVVIYTDATGQVQTVYVTPDPSIPVQNPTGALGWLDVLAYNLFNVKRILSTFAGGTLAIVNTSVSTYGPFSPTTYHVGQPNASGAPTYHNTAILTIAPSTVLGTVTTVSGGGAGGSIRIFSTGSWTVGQNVFIIGELGAVEANGAWVISATDGSTYFDLAGSLFFHFPLGGGVIYAPTLAALTADIAGSASSATTANVVTQSITSLIGVSVSNLAPWLGSDTEGNVALAARCRLKLSSIAATGGPKGAYAYYALVAQQLAPTLSPPESVAAIITRVLVQLDYLTGTVTVTLANGSGVPGSHDVLVVRDVIQAFTVLFTAKLVVQAAGAVAVATSGTIYLPAAYNTTTNQALANSTAQAYINSVPIAGVSDPSGPQNVLPIEGVRGAIEVAFKSAAIPIQDMTITLNGVADNVSLAGGPPPQVAVPSTPTIMLTSA